MWMKYLFTYISILFCFSIKAQTANIKSVEQKGQQIYITYDLQGSPGKYEIKLFVKSNNSYSWSSALKSVSGNVGPNQSTGKNKQIIWDVLEDRDQFQGDWVFGIEAINVLNSYKTYRKQNSIYLELGGLSQLGSINYERYIFNRPKFKIASVIGLGLSPNFSFYYSYSSIIESFALTIPLNSNFIFFERTNHLELGTGILFSSFNENNSVNSNGLSINSYGYTDYGILNKIVPHYNCYLGYRYQKNKKLGYRYQKNKKSSPSLILRSGINLNYVPFVKPHGRSLYMFLGVSVGIDF